MYVNLNGRLVPEDQAKISVYDHGFLYGDGIFDTMCAYQGKVFRLERHLDRLEQNARTLALAMPWSREELLNAIYRTIQANELQDAYIRLTVTRGAGPIGLDPRLCPEPAYVVMVKQLTQRETVYSEGIASIVLKTRRNPLECLDPRVKSLNFLNNIFAKLELIEGGFTEGIMLNYEGQVAEGTVSNIFWAAGGMLFTPEVNVGILPGITRDTVLELAGRLKVSVREGSFSPADLLQAEEIFFTNSSGELIPVVSLDGRQVGSGKPGSLTRRLHEAYRAAVRNIDW